MKHLAATQPIGAAVSLWLAAKPQKQFMHGKESVAQYQDGGGIPRCTKERIKIPALTHRAGFRTGHCYDKKFVPTR
jgi:hypothetical protein